MEEPAHLRTMRATYDTVAVNYARFLPDLRAETALDQAMVARLAELTSVGRPRADRRPRLRYRRITAHLDSLGVEAFGIDLSPAMVGLAALDSRYLGVVCHRGPSASGSRHRRRCRHTGRQHVCGNSAEPVPTTSETLPFAA